MPVAAGTITPKAETAKAVRPNPEVGFESGVQQQHDDSDPRDRFEQMVREHVGRKDERVQAWCEMAEDGRSQQDAGQQFADHGRLSEALHHVGQGPRDHEEQRELDQKTQDLNFCQMGH
jgi:hypothetical protein